MKLLVAGLNYMKLQFVEENLHVLLWSWIKINHFSLIQNRSTGALVVSSLLDFLTFALCPPYRYNDNNYYNKQLLDEVFVISRVIKVEVRVITKTKSNNELFCTCTCTLNGKNGSHVFCFFIDGKRQKVHVRELDMITRDLECPWHPFSKNLKLVWTPPTGFYETVPNMEPNHAYQMLII